MKSTSLKFSLRARTPRTFSQYEQWFRWKDHADWNNMQFLRNLSSHLTSYEPQDRGCGLKHFEQCIHRILSNHEKHFHLMHPHVSSDEDTCQIERILSTERTRSRTSRSHCSVPYDSSLLFPRSHYWAVPQIQMLLPSRKVLKYSEGKSSPSFTFPKFKKNPPSAFFSPHSDCDDLCEAWSRRMRAQMLRLNFWEVHLFDDRSAPQLLPSISRFWDSPGRRNADEKYEAHRRTYLLVFKRWSVGVQ